MSAVAGLGALTIIHQSYRASLRTGGTALVLERVVRRALTDDDGPSPQLMSLAVVESAHHASGAIVDVVLPLVADAIGAVVGLALLTQSKESVFLPAFALLVVTAGLVATKFLTRPRDESFLRYTDAVASLTDALDGRRELLASGVSAEFALQAHAQINRWRKSVLVSSLHRGVVSRLPMIASVVVAFAVVFPRGFASSAVQQMALLLVVAAACVGLVRNLHELSMLRTRVAPLVDLFGVPAIASTGSTPLPPLTGVGWRNVTVAYEGRAVVSDASLEVAPGEVVAVTGPNGAGKTTLLEVAVGLRPLAGGQFVVAGEELEPVSRGWRCRVQYLPQRPYLLPERDVRASMEFPPAKLDAKEMRSALARSGLWERLTSFPGDPLAVPTDRLSAGERQRLAIARVLCREREVYLLDEPDANLDADGVAMVVELVRELSGKGKMVVVAAHTPALIAAADRVVRLDRGLLVSTDSRRRLASASGRG